MYKIQKMGLVTNFTMGPNWKHKGPNIKCGYYYQFLSLVLVIIHIQIAIATGVVSHLKEVIPWSSPTHAVRDKMDYFKLLSWPLGFYFKKKLSQNFVLFWFVLLEWIIEDEKNSFLRKIY